jgi:hypothetical protein
MKTQCPFCVQLVNYLLARSMFGARIFEMKDTHKPMPNTIFPRVLKFSKLLYKSKRKCQNCYAMHTFPNLFWFKVQVLRLT